MQELWQIEVQNRIYQADTSELIEWIKEGSIQPDDKVRRGNLRWLNASRIPQLRIYFRTTVGDGVAATASDATIEIERNGVIDGAVEAAETIGSIPVSDPHAGRRTDPNYLKHCLRHAGKPTSFVCNVCGSPLCGECTNRFGTVRLCSLCSGMCVTLEDFQHGTSITGALNKPYARKTLEKKRRASDGLGVREVVDAIKYALRLSTGRVFKLLLFVTVTVGMAAAFVQTIPAIAVAFVAFLLLLSLAFDILMTASKDYGHHDDGAASSDGEISAPVQRYVRSLLSGANAVVVSFGLCIVITFAAGTYAWYAFSTSLDNVESQMRQEGRAIDSTARREMVTDLDAKILRARNEIMSSAFGQVDSDENPQIERTVTSFMRLSIWFLTPIFVSLLIGAVYFPSACLNLLRGSSFRRLASPRAGLARIWSLGYEYVKILFLLLTMVTVTAAAGVGTFALIRGFSSTPVALISTVSLLGGISFLLWTAFSYVLAQAVHKHP